MRGGIRETNLHDHYLIRGRSRLIVNQRRSPTNPTEILIITGTLLMLKHDYFLQMLQKCIRPSVPMTTNGNAVHLILPEVMEFVKQKTGKHFNLKKLRKSIEDCEGTSVDHSSIFNGKQHRCVKIPRSILEGELIQLIDRGTMMLRYLKLLPNTLIFTRTFLFPAQIKLF